jgi:uncharacterized coiled-coil protein SlyX
VPLGDVQRSGACGEAPAPIGSIAEQQFSTKSCEILQDWKDRQSRDGGPATAKKRRTDLESDVSIEGNDFLQKVENAVANACRGFVVPAATGGSGEDIQSLRSEMKEGIARVQTQLTETFSSAMAQMQAETDRRTAEMLERLTQQVHDASKQTNKGGTIAAHATSEEAMQSLRVEMREDIARVQAQLTELLNDAMAKMQTESDRRAEAMLGRLVQKIQEASEQTVKSAAAAATAHAIPGVDPNQQSHSQPAQNAQRTWANVTRADTQTVAGWATVANPKKKLKKHPLDQRRILFIRDSRSHHCDTRDIMFDVNKALAHARADVAVRLIKLKYTEKGNLSGVLRENACAEDLLEYAPAVMAAVQKLDPAVIDIEKTEK